MRNIFILIDESGTLPDPGNQLVVVAAVGTRLPKKLAAIHKKARQFLRKKDTSEIKFYRAGERTKKKFLEKLIQEDLEIFVLVVEKRGRRIEDSPENFGLICWLLLEDCLLFYKDTVAEVIFDKHFHRQKDLQEFNRILIKLLGQKLKISHVDSQQNPQVNASDMVAGSILWSETGKDKQFYEIIKKRIISKKVLNWKEIKRKFLTKKNLSEPA